MHHSRLVPELKVMAIRWPYPQQFMLSILLLKSMCLILVFVHLQVVAGMSAMLDVFVVHINVD